MGARHIKQAPAVQEAIDRLYAYPASLFRGKIRLDAVGSYTYMRNLGSKGIYGMRSSEGGLSD